mmetsp:Transcript_58540/g.141269  ORF Transcript_58540/g.141269 Transcript_58540/m.141269 type:complete len:521 (+) Transcript_58540:68-1630(+)
MAFDETRHLVSHRAHAAGFEEESGGEEEGSASDTSSADGDARTFKLALGICAGCAFLAGCLALLFWWNGLRSEGPASIAELVGKFNCSRHGANVTAFSNCLVERQQFFSEHIKDMPAGVQSVANEFDKFLAKYNRAYHEGLNVSEYKARLLIFYDTLQRVVERNAKENATHPNRVKHGITKFADWTPGEFQALLGGRLKNQTSNTKSVGGISSTAPCTKNWASRGQVRNQGACGDCWAFSTAETVRAASIQQRGFDPGPLSTQYLVDCMMAGQTCQGGVNGCCGGNPAQAMQWLEKQGGLPTQEAYGDYYAVTPEEASQSPDPQAGPSPQAGPVSHSGDGDTYSGNAPTTSFPCKTDIPKAVTLRGAPVEDDNEEFMTTYVCNTGSISILVDASQWQTYSGGVMSAASCGTTVNHAVVAIGLDASQNAWIVQNSWGLDWGVALDGTSAPTDEYSNCATLAGPTKAGCSGMLTTGQTVMSVCPASCGPADQPTGGYIYLQYGSNTCAIADAPVIVPQTADP